MNLSERLLMLRNERNMSQKQVADAAGMLKRTYQRYEYGERVPTIDQLVSLADVLDVSLDYLVGRTETPADDAAIDNAYFRTRLRQLREANDLSQKQLAEAAGCSERSIVRYENGETVPLVHPAVDLAQALHSTVEYLFGTIDDPSPNAMNGRLSVADLWPPRNGLAGPQ